MNIGLIIRIIESVVTIYCGVKLAVRPGEMRWDNKIIKAIFNFFVIVVMISDILNSLTYKFSSVSMLILLVFLFIILLVFYNTYFWQIFAQFFIYWYTIILFHYIIICTCCVMQSISIQKYLIADYGVQWHWLHIIGMIFEIVASIFIFKWKKGRPLFECKFRKGYILISCILIIEILAGEILFNHEITMDIISKNYLIISVLIIWTLFIMLLMILVFKEYKDSVHQKMLSEMNLAMIQKQYALLQDMYAEKRRQIHDSVHHDIIVMEYLKDKNYDAALNYFEEKMDKMKSQQRNKYTGLSVIDLMLDYKLNQASEYDIKVNLDIDVYFCPIDETEMCVLLGNLLDNAIEATKDLPEELRRIDICMKNPNSIFILEIKNPYEGKRKKIEEHYLTTKPDKNIHGLGLDSVRKIVERNNGFIEIHDEKQLFTVVVTIFARINQLKNKQKLNTDIDSSRSDV